MFRGVYFNSNVFWNNHFYLITNWSYITWFILLQLINHIRQNVKRDWNKNYCGSRMSSKILMSSQVNPPSQEKSSITDSRCCLGGGHWEVMELLPILIKNCRYLKKNILLYGSFLRQHNFQIIFLIHKRWQWAVGWNPAVATCRMIRLTKNEEKKYWE